MSARFHWYCSGILLLSRSSLNDELTLASNKLRNESVMGGNECIEPPFMEDAKTRSRQFGESAASGKGLLDGTGNSLQPMSANGARQAWWTGRGLRTQEQLV